MPQKTENIELRQVATNNLKSIDVTFPLGKITAVTGVSGSGKSSLVFDTLYGESYRRYVESLSSFARQYMQSIPKPNIEKVINLPPAIAVKQVKSQANSRSTVGTATELYDLMRILYTHMAKPICGKCGHEIVAYTSEKILKDVMENNTEQQVMITAQLLSYKSGKVRDLKDQLMTFGFVRAILDGQVKRLEELNSKNIFDAAVIIDRVRINEDNKTRVLEAIKTAGQLSRGGVKIYNDQNEKRFYPTTKTCCGHTMRDASPALFSFNHPFGACQTCQGFGAEGTIDWDKVFPDLNSSLKDLGIAPWNFGSHDDMYDWARQSARKNKKSITKAFKDYSEEDWQWLKFGNGKDDFGGVQGYFDWLNSKRHKAHLRIHAARYRMYVTCSKCKGYRLNEDALSYQIEQNNIGDFCDRSLRDIASDISKLNNEWREEKDSSGVKEALEEASTRLNYLENVGLNYLSLNRQTRTLSGGEFQRINMARCLGSALTDTLYCLDEPTSGLHARDSIRLMEVIRSLRDQGNTVVVVEHERNIIEGADHLIEIGPEAGHRGGQVTYAGAPLKQRQKNRSAMTLSGEVDKKKNFINLHGVSTHNLKNIDVKVPLNAMTVVCGVSGSGKTSLVQHSLYPMLGKTLNQKKLDGYISETKVKSLTPSTLSQKLAQVIHVSQVTIGRSSRSTIATYLGIMNEIRKIYADQPTARSQKLEARHFSFNTSGGRCETCCGLGTVVEDLSFLGEMNIECPECHGKRFADKVLAVRFREKNLNDILKLTIAQARELFFDYPKLVNILDSIIDLGLGYITLGQNTSSFSGGEGQRLKLLRLLQDALNAKPSFLIFDEPTTGLSDFDVENLIAQFRGLLKKGHTVLVVEHHLGVIKSADWVIEIGPDAAENGGRLVYQGAVAGLKTVKESETAKFIDWSEI